MGKIQSFFNKILPDLLAIGGISSIGYGLYLYCPWVSFVVVGVLILAGGILLGRGERA